MDETIVKKKIILVGDADAGKNSILSCLQKDKLPSEFVSSNEEPSTANKQVESKKIKLQFWDSAGQERFKSLAKTMYQDASGILLIYDASNRSTFQSLDNYMSSLLECANPNTFILFIVAKVDSDDRQVSSLEGSVYAESKGANYVEISTNSGLGLLELKEQLYQRIK